MVYFDTNCIIYYVERKPIWLPKVVARIASLFLTADAKLARCTDIAVEVLT